MERRSRTGPARFMAAAVAAVMVVVFLAACSGGTPKSSKKSLPKDPGAVQVVAGQATTLDLGGGADLIIPPGSMTAGATVRATYQGAPGGNWDKSNPTTDPIELISNPPDAIHGLLTLEFPVPVDSLPVGADPATAFGVSTFDPATKNWTSYNSTYDAARHMIVAEIPHFSWWAPWTWDWGAIWRDITQGFGSLVGARSGPAKCSGDVPSWVNSLVGLTNAADIALHACGESQGNVLDIEMQNNRPYGQVLNYGAGVKWGWHEDGSTIQDKLRNTVMDHLMTPNQLYIPPLGSASVGIVEPPAGSSTSWHLGPTGASIGTDLVFYVIGKTIDKIVPLDLGTCVTGVMDEQLSDVTVGALRSDLVAMGECVLKSFTASVNGGLLNKVSVGNLSSTFGVLSKVSVATQGLELAGGLIWKIGDLVADWIGNKGKPLGNGFSVSAKAAAVSPSTPPTTSAPKPPPTTQVSSPGPVTPPPTLYTPPPTQGPPPAPANRVGVTSYNRMSGGAPYWGRATKGWQGFTAQSNTLTVVGVTWSDTNYAPDATLGGVTTRISICQGVGTGSDPCIGRIADGLATVVNQGNTSVDFGDIAVTPGATYYVFYYQPATQAGSWDMYWWNCPACSGTGRQSSLNSDQNQMVVQGYNR
jgi:hypothetical protein